MLRNSEQSGFTLIELMLAMVLFSTVLVISTVGFIGMNRTFSRGTIRKQLSEAVQSVSEDITRTMRAQPTDSTPLICEGGAPPCATGFVAANWHTLSFANKCYLWQTSNTPAYEGGLYTKNGPCKADSINGKTMLLSDRYVVREGPFVELVDVATVVTGGQLYSVSGVFSTREDDAVHIPTGPSDSWRCKGTAESPNVNTCAVEKFNFIVNPRGNSL